MNINAIKLHPLIKGYSHFFTIGLILIITSLIIISITKPGIGIPPDAVTYIKGARSILENGNLQSLSPHWPPLYFIVAAISGFFHENLLVSLRWLQVILFLSNISLVGLVLYRQTRANIIITACGMLAIAFSPAIFKLHACVLSEALYFLLSILGLTLLNQYIKTNKMHMLFLAAFLVSSAFITRYIGVSLVVSGAIILLINNVGWRKRILDCLLWSISSSSLMLFWLARNYFSETTTTGRIFSYHAISEQNITGGLYSFLKFFYIPYELRMAFPLVLLILFVVYVFSLKKNKPANQYDKDYLDTIYLIYIACYSTVLVFSLLFIDAHTLIDERTLSPVYLFFVLIFLLMVARILDGCPDTK
jgi:hypothetical protein